MIDTTGAAQDEPLRRRRDGAAAGSRRRSIRSLEAALARCLLPTLFAMVTLSCSPGEGDARPNLLLITVDTLRADALACYGGGSDVGETLCSIGDSGVRYLWAISPAPSTAPAVASILTSRYPSSHRVSQFASSVLPDAIETLAERLTEADYATAAIVANPVLAPRRRLNQGFSYYDARMNRRERNRPGALERDARDATDAAIAWLEEASSPWFLWIHYQDPHGPYDAPGALAVEDAADADRLPVLADHSGRSGIPAYQALPDTFSVESYSARYQQEIRYLDGQVERLLRAVESSRRPTGVLLTADHGEAFGEDDYWFAHGHSVGIEQVRVPLLWHPPGMSKQRGPLMLGTPVSTIDVAPTLLEAAGLPIPDFFEGRRLPISAEESVEEEGDGSDSRLLFTEHRMRAGLVAGGVYFTRDRGADSEPSLDRITGGRLEPMSPRVQRLASDGRLPQGQLADSTALEETLSPLLSRFLQSTLRRDEPREKILDDELREQLERLGYLE